MTQTESSTGTGPRQIIHVDDQPWIDWIDETGFAPDGSQVRFLADGCKLGFVLGKMPPNFVVPSHWHPNDTVYIFQKGTVTIEGEGTYRPGDVRWTKGGVQYGTEVAGPDGAEFYLVTSGDIEVKNPAVEPPPGG